MAILKLSDYLEAYYYGTEGETLFHQPYPTKFGKLHDNSRDPILARNKTPNQDDRSLALVSAMVSENYIDRMLKLLLPSFEFRREGAASMKISLLAAFAIIPKHLTSAAQLLNKTRNEFAHNLQLTSFAELDDHKPELTKSMRGLCKSRKILVPESSREVPELFEVMFKMATTGILYFEENVRFYTEFTRTLPFIKAIGEMQNVEVRRHNDALLEALRQHQSAPIRDEPPAVT
jgi:hypothetical protein